MTAVITGMLWVRTADLTLEQLERIKQQYTYPHPFDTEAKSFTTYLEKGDNIGVPYGDASKVRKLLPNITVNDKRVVPPVDKPFTSSIVLRDYQETVVSGIDDYIKGGGTSFNLAGNPGSGKSITLAVILANLGVKTLILANQSMLITQLYDEFKANTTADVKILTASDYELTDINIATSQFISQNSDVWYALKKGVGCVVLDEAHSLASPTTTAIIQRIYARYSIFISATFSRSSDARTSALTDFAGPTTFTLDNPKLLIPNVMMVQCPERYPRFTSKFQAAKDKVRFFSQYSIDEKVIRLVEASLKKNRQVLVVTDIVDMQERLNEKLKEHSVGILNGMTTDKDRAAILRAFDNGDIKILLGGMVLNAGLSIPKISTIIRVSFPSSPEKNTQVVGRALREFPGKDGAFIFDLVFKGKSSRTREAAYKQMGWKVTHHSWDVLSEKL